MATFTEAQVTSLAEIFETTSDAMGTHLTYRAGLITDSDKTAIVADVTAYQAIENDNVYISAGPANFQGRISPSEARSLIARRIGALIGWESVSGGRLVRA